ncbi:MAG: hypothetical protein U5K33_05890 [Halofilum sp. (in: g-proteobacteria)]|nr:hypothetical protein [Halofilum sp. (in: g-proteobacteria)]
MNSASPSPIAVASTVVARKNTPPPMPSVFSSPVPLPASPRTIEANTSGTTIICTSTRKIWPGSASQLTIVCEVAGSTQPTPGPSSTPVAMPSTMPITTFSQRRPSTSRLRVPARLASGRRGNGVCELMEDTSDLNDSTITRVAPRYP